MLQRIYGTVFPDAAGLDEHLRFLEEAKKRDHRLLGKNLDLFSLQEEVGPGLVYWHPKGARVRHDDRGLLEAASTTSAATSSCIPRTSAASWLWQTCGHLDFYQENMYAPMDIDEHDYYIKPMNCPFHILIYKSSQRSYRDLPLRWAELGTVYRYERSGVLHGLLRVRGFTQDDAHIFCTPEQIDDEILRTLDFCPRPAALVRLQRVRDRALGPRPADSGKYVGSDEQWDEADASLRKALAVRRAALPAHGGRGASSTGPRSTSRSRTPSAASGSAPPSSSTSTCRSAST